MTTRTVRARTVVVGGVVVTALAVVGSLCFGAYPVSVAEVLSALFPWARGGGGGATATRIVLDHRLPRAVGALVVGAGLGTSGAMLQALLRNPLASPFVIGTAQAAGFGAVLSIALGLPALCTSGLAFAAAVAAAFLVLSLSRTRRSLPTEAVVLTGLAVSLLFGALIGLVRYLAHDEGVLGRIAVWIVGGLWQVTWPALELLAPPIAVAVGVSCLLWRRLDLLALGEADAQRLGVRVRATGTAVLLLTCVMTSLAICVGGVVAFVGLIVPHAARRLVGPAQSSLLPASALLGGVFVIVTDTVARSAVQPEELPLGVVTSLVGVPAFLVVLRSLRRRREGL